MVAALHSYGADQQVMCIEAFIARQAFFTKAGTPDKAGAKPLGIKALKRHFKAELATGLGRSNSRVAESLFKRAVDLKHPQGAICAMFWMKTRANWSEKSRVEHTGKDGAPIAFETMLAAATPEELTVVERLLARQALAAAPAAANDSQAA